MRWQLIGARPDITATKVIPASRRGHRRPGWRWQQVMGTETERQLGFARLRIVAEFRRAGGYAAARHFLEMR